MNDTQRLQQVRRYCRMMMTSLSVTRQEMAGDIISIMQEDISPEEARTTTNEWFVIISWPDAYDRGPELNGPFVDHDQAEDWADNLFSRNPGLDDATATVTTAGAPRNDQEVAS